VEWRSVSTFYLPLNLPFTLSFYLYLLTHSSSFSFLYSASKSSPLLFFLFFSSKLADSPSSSSLSSYTSVRRGVGISLVQRQADRYCL